MGDGRGSEPASEVLDSLPPSPSRLRIERAQLLQVLPSFLSLIYFKSAAEALGSWVFPSLYVISLLQISCEAQSGKPGDSWERGGQAPSQDSGSKIRQLPTRCLDEDCVLNLIYIWNLKKSSRQSIDLVARGWSLRKEVERHWCERLKFSTVSWASSRKRMHGHWWQWMCQSIGLWSSSYNTPDYQIVLLYTTNKYRLYLENQMLSSVFENIFNW